MLYNDAFIPTLGDKHPGALGTPLPEVFAEVWDAVGPMQLSVLAGGEATWEEDLPLIIERGRGPEQTFFTFSYSHVPDEDGPGGVLAVVGHHRQGGPARRLALLNGLAGATVRSHDPDEALAAALGVVGGADRDVLGAASTAGPAPTRRWSGRRPWGRSATKRSRSWSGTSDTSSGAAWISAASLTHGTTAARRTPREGMWSPLSRAPQVGGADRSWRCCPTHCGPTTRITGASSGSWPTARAECRQRDRAREERPTCSAGRARRRQDRVHLQHQPRVPYAADPRARPAGGRGEGPRPGRSVTTWS